MDFLKNSNLGWLHDSTHLLVRSGSFAYGTNVPGSDEDFKGVAIPPRRYILGVRDRFEQAEFKSPDAVVYDLRKFCRLAAECNPNIIEMLYSDPGDIIRLSGAGLLLRASRDIFLSSKARHTFCGYARAQLKRLRGHYAHLTAGPPPCPRREDFGLPAESTLSMEERSEFMTAIDKKLAEWSLDLEGLDPAAAIAIRSNLAEQWAAIDKWDAAAKTIGITGATLETLRAERSYRSAERAFKQYNDWLKNRNAARFQLEEKYGYDTKHAMHLVRLLRMAEEILRDGKVIVKRPDAEELVGIRLGEWSYEKLISYADETESRVVSLYNTTNLRRSPDWDKIDDLCIQLLS